MSEHIQAEMYYMVKKYLDGKLNSDVWRYTVDDDVPFFHGFTLHNNEVSDMKFGFFIAGHSVLCYTQCPIPVPEAMRSSVAEYIIRVNEKELEGCFEMVYDEGFVRYKKLLPYNDLHNEKVACASLVKAKLAAMLAWQRYGENLFALMLNETKGKTVAQLAAESESKQYD